MSRVSFFIPGNVPSSKNSKRVVKHGGRTLVISSKQTMAYIKATEFLWVVSGKSFKRLVKDMKKPLVVEFEFVRGSQHKFDYINPAQTVQDLMVKYGWLDDDNCDEIIPVFLPYSYDKKNPGVYIHINANNGKE
jgi:hypothetical protein